MSDEERQFLEEQLIATELLLCTTCREVTLQAHVEVLKRYAQATELLMECTSCGTRRRWLEPQHRA